MFCVDFKSDFVYKGWDQWLFNSNRLVMDVFIYVPICITAIKPLLRRTLVRSYRLSSKSQIVIQASKISHSTKHRSFLRQDDKQEGLLIVRSFKLVAS